MGEVRCMPRATRAEYVRPVAASLDASAAAAARWDALVIGAGPAGAMSALQLARAGFSTLLVDRKTFPRSKVCGGCLNAHALAALSRAGLAAELRDLGARPVHAIQLRHERRQVCLPLPSGLAVSRTTLDAWLVRKAIEAGVSFLPATTATVLPDAKAAGSEEVRGVRLRERDQSEVTTSGRLVLVADGLGHSSLRESAGQAPQVAAGSHVGVGGIVEGHIASLEAGTIAMAIGSRGYAGAVEVEGGRTNVAAALDADFLRRMGGPAEAVSRLFDEAGIAVSEWSLGSVEWSGTMAVTRKLESPCGRRFLVLGDAAGYVEPFTGEGMAWALTSAESVVEFAERAVSGWDRSLEAEWVSKYRRLVGNEMRWCRFLAALLRRPILVRSAMTALRIHPGVARPLLAHLTLRTPVD